MGQGEDNHTGMAHAIYDHYYYLSDHPFPRE
jgi:hypothetical protein